MKRNNTKIKPVSLNVGLKPFWSVELKGFPNNTMQVFMLAERKHIALALWNRWNILPTDTKMQEQYHFKRVWVKVD